MRRREPHPHLRSRLGNRSKQTRERNRFITLTARIIIGIDILTQKRHLPVALRAKVLQLGENRRKLAGTFTPARIRHDAVRAEIIAAAHDRDEAADKISRQSDRNNLAIGLRRAQFDIDRLFARLDRRKKRR